MMKLTLLYLVVIASTLVGAQTSSEEAPSTSPLSSTNSALSTTTQQVTQFIILCGGKTESGVTSAVTMIDLQSFDTFDLPLLPSPVAAQPLGFILQGRHLYVCGGVDEFNEIASTCTMIDLKGSNSGWVQSIPLPVALASASGTMLSDENTFFFCGGVSYDIDSETYSLRAESYTFDGVGWTQVDSLGATRAGHSVVLFKNNLVAMGGATDMEGSYTLTCEVFMNNQWTEFPSMTYARVGFSAAVDGDYIFAAGGGVNAGYVERYVSDSLLWEVLAPLLANPHMSGTGFFNNGRFSVVGGGMGATVDRIESMSSLTFEWSTDYEFSERYEFASAILIGSITEITQTVIPVSTGTTITTVTTSSPSPYLIVIGGTDETGLATDRVLAFNIISSTWFVLQPLPFAVSGNPIAFVLGQDELHLCGGVSFDGSVLSTCIKLTISDPVQNWIETTPLPFPLVDSGGIGLLYGTVFFHIHILSRTGGLLRQI